MNVFKQLINTMFIIGLFCLVTLVVPLVFPSIELQVMLYVIITVVSGYIIHLLEPTKRSK